MLGWVAVDSGRSCNKGLRVEVGVPKNSILRRISTRLAKVALSAITLPGS